MDNDDGDIWYTSPAIFDQSDPVVGVLFSDSPQSKIPLQSPRGGRLVRCASSWEFGCWLIARTKSRGHVKFLYHQDWTASFHVEYRNGVASLSSREHSLGDAGVGPGTLKPLMEGTTRDEYLGRPDVWAVLTGELLHKDGEDLL